MFGPVPRTMAPALLTILAAVAHGMASVSGRPCAVAPTCPAKSKMKLAVRIRAIPPSPILSDTCANHPTQANCALVSKLGRAWANVEGVQVVSLCGFGSFDIRLSYDRKQL